MLVVFADGEWRSDQRHGSGVAVFANGLKYKGAWKHDKADGDGSCVYPSGDEYTGEWKNDHRCARIVRHLVCGEMKALKNHSLACSDGAGAAILWLLVTRMRDSGMVMSSMAWCEHQNLDCNSPLRGLTSSHRGGTRMLMAPSMRENTFKGSGCR
jgi:hypothetical protein